MKILPLQLNKSYAFKAKQNEELIAFDDGVSKNVRNNLRQGIYDRLNLEYYDKYGGQLNKYELNSLVSTFTKNPIPYIPDEDNDINTEILRKLPMYNVKKIFGLASSYRGSVGNITTECLDVLKQAGIKRVVKVNLLEGSINTPKEEYEKRGLELFNFTTYPTTRVASKEAIELEARMETDLYCYFLSEEQREAKFQTIVRKKEKYIKSYIDKIVELVQFMQQEKVYIGCGCGVTNTNDVLMINHFFNPAAQETPNCVTKDNYQLLQTIRTLYEYLTEEQKAKMGWDDDFDKNFLKRIDAEIERWNGSEKNRYYAI